jgi:hypothetical protein
MSRTRLVLLAVVALAAAIPASVIASGKAETLLGSVGPGFTIAVTKADGTTVSSLDPGSYTLTVNDQSEGHNFHLNGPGVDVATGVEEIGQRTFDLAFTDGIYRFVCDVHPGMNGSFTVGNPPAPPLPPPKPTTPKLFGTVGTAITLKNAAGARVRSVKAGTYLVVVKDTSAAQNFHLSGTGVDRKTTVPGRATVTWRVRFVKGKLYTYRSDAAATKLRGTFKAV